MFLFFLEMQDYDIKSLGLFAKWATYFFIKNIMYSYVKLIWTEFKGFVSVQIMAFFSQDNL